MYLDAFYALQLLRKNLCYQPLNCTVDDTSSDSLRLSQKYIADRCYFSLKDLTANIFIFFIKTKPEKIVFHEIGLELSLQCTTIPKIRNHIRDETIRTLRKTCYDMYIGE